MKCWVLTGERVRIKFNVMNSQATIEVGYTLRQATGTDAETIHSIISRMQLNPMSLDWRRFTLAIDKDGKVIGCGQVKPHGDGSFELASIGVLPEWRHQGVARAIIEQLLSQHPGALYLTCRAKLEPMYEKFGFRTISRTEMPPYFRRISWLVRQFARLSHQPNELRVMRRN